MSTNQFWSKEIWPNDNIAEITTYMGSYSLSGFADGFLEISEIAIEKARLNQCSIDTVMPAILYNIRHSVELFLKYMLSEIPDGSGGTIIASGHDIKGIFANHKDDIQCYLEHECLASPFSFNDWLKAFEEIINFVDAFDPDGQSMRYPADRKGNPNLGGKALVSTNDVFCLIKYIRSYFDEYYDRGN
jgi:hypothetical protein